jgi:hypothetical protein
MPESPVDESEPGPPHMEILGRTRNNRGPFTHTQLPYTARGYTEKARVWTHFLAAHAA